MRGPPRTLFIALAVAALLTATVVLAAPQARDRTDLATQMDVARLVDLSASRLKVSIEYDAAAVQGTATLRMAQGVSDLELWHLTCTACTHAGERGGWGAAR